MKKLITVIMIIPLLALFSCEDNRDEGYIEGKIYLTKAGWQIESIDADRSEATASFWATRSGLLKESCTVTYRMDIDILTQYNEDNETSYEILPEGCYTIPQTVFSITADELNAKFAVTYYPDKIVQAAGGKEYVGKYVLPISITATPLEVTAANYVFMSFVPLDDKEE